MKKILLFLVFAFAITEMQAQFVYKIKADSVLITNDSCTAELNLENSTKNVKGFLYNKGNGRTEFRRAVKLNDSTIIFGTDTLLIRGVGGQNFANTDLTLTGNRTHHGNYYSLNLDTFGLFRFNAAKHAIEGDSGSTEVLIDTTGFYVNKRENSLDSSNFSISYGNLLYQAYAQAVTGYFQANSANVIMYSANEALGSQANFYLSQDGQMYLQGNEGIFNSSAIDNSKTMIIQTELGDSILLLGYIPSTLTPTTKYKQTHDRFEFRKLNGVNDFRLIGLPSSASSDDSVLVSDANGQIKKRGQSQIGTFTLQQVTANGNTTTNNIKPYPNALPVGSSTDSIVVWSATDSLLKKVAPMSSLTLQQVTTNGNTTTNTIKPYPAALPVGAGTDSVVVWSSADSLLKKVGSKQTFTQTTTATISASNDETTLTSSGAGSLTIPAASWFPGKTFKIVIHGTYSTSDTDPANLTIKIKLGTTVIAQSSLFLGSGKSDISFELRAELTCRTTGSSGTIFTMGMINSGDDWVSQIDNGTSAATVNLSTSQTLDITATLSDDHAGNSISAYAVLLEAMN